MVERQHVGRHQPTSSAGGDGFRHNIAARHRSGRVWHVVFQASTIIGIIALTALLFNIINQSFGLVAIENEIEPEALAVDCVPLEELDKEQLVLILRDNVSNGLFRRFESELPFAERTRADVYDLVFERVVEPQAVATWSLYDSLLNPSTVRAEAADKYPEAEIRFVSWIDPKFITTPQ